MARSRPAHGIQDIQHSHAFCITIWLHWQQAKEGTIEEGSTAWDNMSVTDRSKRKRAAEEKNLKLRSPNFSVSRTRLSVRNLPFTLQEKDLKQLFITAVSSPSVLYEQNWVLDPDCVAVKQA